MKAPQFADLLTRLLRESAHPGIANVATERISSADNPVIHCTDGSEIHLQIVTSSPPGGDRDDAEPVVREPGSPIRVGQREH
ncbi:hypothetical protein [Actinophytocola sp.]|uniref:hypothetical protein n=1 Tax=Actinophytocola sp. TaxID=1872138 RepID=UPI003D6A0E29